MFYPHYARGGLFYPRYARVKQLYPPPYVREKQLSSSGFSLAAIKIPGEGNLYSFQPSLHLSKVPISVKVAWNSPKSAQIDFM